MSKVNYFGDMDVDAEDLDFTEYGKSDEIRDSIKAAISTFGVGIKDHGDTYLKVVNAFGHAVVSPGYAIDALGRTIYLPQDRSAVGSTPGAPGYHPAWPDSTIPIYQVVDKYLCIEYAEQAGQPETDDEGNVFYMRYYKSYSITIEDSISGLNTETNPKIPLAKVTGGAGEGYTLTDIRPILRFWSAGSDLDSHQKIEHCNGLIPSGSDSLLTAIHQGAVDYVEVTQIISDASLYLNGNRLMEVLDLKWNPTGLSENTYNLYYEGSGSLGATALSASTDLTKYYIASVFYDGNGNLSNLVDERVYYGMKDDMVRNTSNTPGNNVKEALNNALDKIDYDVRYLRRDGGNNMTGDLDVNEHDITNVQTLTGSTGIDIEATELLIDNDTSTSGNISLSSGKAVDGIDISEYQRGFDYIVEENTIADDTRGTVTLNTALYEASKSEGVSIFIKNGDYTLPHSYTLKENTTIIGENPNVAAITFSGYHLYFGSETSPNSYFLVKNLKFLLDSEERLKFYDRGVLENCWLEVDTNTSFIYMGKSKFVNILATTARTADAQLYGSELIGCNLREVDTLANCEVINSVFDQVRISGSGSKFVNSSGSNFYGWILASKEIGGGYTESIAKFSVFTNCEGNIKNANIGEGNYFDSLPYASVSGHKGNWIAWLGMIVDGDLLYSGDNWCWDGNKWNSWINCIAYWWWE